MKPVTVIIPVYNAFEVTLDCIRSVLAHAPSDVRVCVIDDASPSGDLLTFLPKDVTAHPSLTVLRNEKNQGFVGTCNRGMVLESEGDVILLNSDTLVTRGWVHKLQKAAYSRPNVGTVTPLTNNGTICSVPCFLENNSIPEGYNLDSFSALVEALSEGSYVEAPTCVGFCTYIRRELLDSVGVFDPVFKQGYGEENDLSLRAQKKGFLNIIDDATYIYHRGNMSFKDMREALSEANSKILNERYPDYESSVAQFCAKNPLGRVHARIWNSLVSRFVAGKQRTVLHVLHNGPFVGRHHSLGGTELHVQSIIRNDPQSAHFSVSPGRQVFYFTAHLDGVDRTLELPYLVIPALFSPDLFTVIHVHHLLGFDREQLVESLSAHGNYIVSIHDYHLVCGRLWLTRPDYSVCDGVMCQGCSFESVDVATQYRALARKLLESASRIIVFSESSRSIITRTLETFPHLEVLAHGIEQTTRNPVATPCRPTKDFPLKVLCLGTFVKHKGSEILREASHTITDIGDVPVEWHFLGRADGDVGLLINHGGYTPENLRDKAAEIGAHVVLLAPQCQETYSITLDEAVWSGLPVISSPFGALPERIQGWGVGYVFDNSMQGLRSVLANILNDWPDFLTKVENTRVAPIRGVSSEVEDCAEIYAELSRDGVLKEDAIVRFIQPDLVDPPPQKKLSFGGRLARALRYIEAHEFGSVRGDLGQSGRLI